MFIFQILSIQMDEDNVLFDIFNVENLNISRRLTQFYLLQMIKSNSFNFWSAIKINDQTFERRNHLISCLPQNLLRTITIRKN